MKPGKLMKKKTERVAIKNGDNLDGSGDGLRDRIAAMAYELYEQHGRIAGQMWKICLRRRLSYRASVLQSAHTKTS